jgi:hypothetical protein
MPTYSQAANNTPFAFRISAAILATMNEVFRDLR